MVHFFSKQPAGPDLFFFSSNIEFYFGRRTSKTIDELDKASVVPANAGDPAFVEFSSMVPSKAARLSPTALTPLQLNNSSEQKPIQTQGKTENMFTVLSKLQPVERPGATNEATVLENWIKFS